MLFRNICIVVKQQKKEMISTKFRVIVSWRVGREGQWMNAMRDETTRSFEATGNVPFFTLL